MTARLAPEEGAALLTLARAAIEANLFDDGTLAAVQAAIPKTPALSEKRGCFVTLKTPGRDGRLELRGCIGSTEAKLPAREAVVTSALEAAFADPRFAPLAREEHPGLVVSVSVLTPMAKVEGAEAIDVLRDGVALECDGRFALFLPEVAAEHGWTRTQLLEHLARKAGLPADAWRRARLSTFQSERFGEPERPGC